MNETKKEFEARFGHEPPKGGIYGYIQHQNWMRRLQDWTEAYEAGEIAMREKAAKTMESLSANWVNSLPMDGVQSLNCKQYARAIRALPLSGAEESKKEKA